MNDDNRRIDIMKAAWKKLNHSEEVMVEESFKADDVDFRYPEAEEDYDSNKKSFKEKWQAPDLPDGLLIHHCDTRMMFQHMNGKEAIFWRGLYNI